MAFSWHRAILFLTGLLCLVPAVRGADPHPPTDDAFRLQLTQEEQAWIREHPSIRVTALDDYAPYLITQRDGNLAGLTVNLIELIAQRTGLRFDYHRYQTVDSALGDFRAGRGDILPALARDNERAKFADFSQPYATGFAVIVTRMDSPYHNSLQELNGLRVGTLRGAVHGQQILAAAPRAELVEYATTQESLVALASGKVDATYAMVGTAAYYIKNLQLSNLRLGSVVGTPMELHIGVRKDWPLLTGIIDKALTSITPDEHKALSDQWIFVAQAPNRWLPWLRWAAIVASAVALFLFYFSRRLARELAERKRIQDELEKTTRALARVSEEKTNMLRSIAHDLRNPLTGIALSNQLLENLVAPTNHEARELVAAQRAACRKMLSHVDELVSPETLQTGRPALHWQQLDLVSVFQEAVRDLAGIAATKDISLVLAPESPQMPFVSDKPALRHVTDNLLSNAIKYSPRGTRVTVNLRRDETGYLLEVVDQGPGVRPEEREAIFDRHFRGSAQPTGNEKSSGLGLWIVRRTLQDLHGRVWCGPGRDANGATFSVFLPYAPPKGKN